MAGGDKRGQLLFSPVQSAWGRNHRPLGASCKCSAQSRRCAGYRADTIIILISLRRRLKVKGVQKLARGPASRMRPPLPQPWANPKLQPQETLSPDWRGDGLWTSSAKLLPSAFRQKSLQSRKSAPSRTLPPPLAHSWPES